MILKFLISLIVLVYSTFGGVMKFEKITDCFDNAQQMIITIEGKQIVLEKGEDKFENILSALKYITKEANEMPAFGVAIDNMVREEMKTGVWIELAFAGECSKDAMTFESLCFEIRPDWYGFNLMRNNNGKYEGRCFYLSLNTSMKDLYDKINNLSIVNTVNNSVNN